MIFLPGYHPAAMYPPADPPGDVPLAIFQAAQRAGATHLSVDGQTAYCRRYGAVYEAGWQGSEFGAWWVVDELPAGAVELEG